MKCDELKDYDIMDIEAIDDERIKASSNGAVVPATRVYIKSEVDAAIAELKEKLAEEREFGVNRAKAADHDIGNLCVEVKNLNNQLRATKRALWLARERRAWCEGQFWFVIESNKPRDICHLSRTNRIHRTPNEWMTYWEKVERLCKKKAEEYK